MSKEASITIRGQAGDLECLYAEGSDLQRPLVVLCHPHPLHGGTMHNKVITTLMRAAGDLGMATLRFNYRGVGKSEGSYGHFSGECEDLTSVLEYLYREQPLRKILLAGFSFGSGVVAAEASARHKSPCLNQIIHLLLVAPPVEKYDFQIRVNQFCCPVVVAYADQDEIVDVAKVDQWALSMNPPPEMILFSGASHFFHGRLVELRDRISAIWKKHLQ